MENQITELAATISEEAKTVEQSEILRELADSELLFVGGGTGNVIF